MRINLADTLGHPLSMRLLNIQSRSFLLGALVEGKRFCLVRWVMDDPVVATLMGWNGCAAQMLYPAWARVWTGKICASETELYAALPDRFIADWDSTMNTRYGHQEDAVVGYNPHKRGGKAIIH